MFRTLKAFLILILIFVLVAAFFRHTLCRLLIEKATARATGLKLSIEDLNLNILNSNLCMRGITLLNPPGFKNEALGKAREIFIKYDLLGSLGGRLHLRLLKADIDEVNIIRNEKGGSNVSALKKGEFKAKASSGTSSTSLARKSVKRIKRKRQPKFLIDRLEISLEKAAFMDYNAGIGQPAVIIFTVKDPCVFKNVSDLGYVVNSVSTRGGFRSLIEGILPKVR
ncbi:MAG: hypothetical protein ISS24_01835 [Candidatus Omnitrophica bacterium]|nr:hypothetical protein [Candidatus Omnitrophota bacterium]